MVREVPNVAMPPASRQRYRRYRLAVLPIACGIAVLLSILCEPDLRAQEGAATIDRLVDIWTSQHQEIATGTVRVTRFRAGPRPDLPAADAQALVSQLDQINGPNDAIERVEAFKSKLLGTLEPGFIPYWRDNIALTFASGRVREEICHHGELQPSDVTVRGDGGELSFQAMHRQCLIHAGKTPKEVTALSDIRILPSTRRKLKGPWQVEPVSRSVALFRSPKTEIVADLNNGYVSRFTVLQDGIVRKEYRQFGNATTEGTNSVFPIATTHLSFADGKLAIATIFVIEDIDLNIDVPETSFQLGAPANISIFDFRKNPNAPTLFVSHESVQDIVKFADSSVPFERRGDVPAGELSSSRIWLSLAVLFTLVLIGLLLYRARR